LTQSIHGFHAAVTDPATGKALNDAQSRDACYTCHPGSATRCLRGAMGNAVAADGSIVMANSTLRSFFPAIAYHLTPGIQFSAALETIRDTRHPCPRRATSSNFSRNSSASPA